MLREFWKGIINERRKSLSAYENSDDALTYLLQNDFHDEDILIDEILATWVAGSYSLKVTNTTLLMNLAINP